ncbi:AI-2E family transporter [Glycomyces buryatensis]|uniref:AI-2E family transporter n=1 Tax=Glycomyces buryatensis TaxID=2570927 RepID=A0A4V4HSU6_9ACTN|nr:AI-2E family transporter [Glycomyces buryatensis]THV43036.1 AI-2E family transporter [Glycomyces buryatensis]
MSRFRRTTARARQLWIGMRLNPYAERVGAARARRGEDEPVPAITAPSDDDLPPIDVAETADDENLERRYVPVGLAVGAAWAWRMLVIGAMIAVVLWLLSHVTIVVIPIAISFLLAAMLQPLAAWLIRHGWNRSLASILVLIAGVGVVVLVMTFVVRQFIDSVPEFWNQIEVGLQRAQEWLEGGPWGLDGAEIAAFLANIQDQVTDWFSDNSQSLVQSGVDIAGTTLSGLGYFFTGLFLCLFATYFFIRDGRKIWNFLTGMLPAAGRDSMRYAGGAGWSTLVQYMRTVIVVAAVDAIFIGLGLWLLDIPLWLPLTTLVFLGAFIPIVGATVSGAVAVVVALVGTENGLWNAVIVLAIVLAVQQIESNLLQPILMSRAVKLHPLAIILAVTAGGFTFGIMGALIAVPVLAIINGTVRALNRYRDARREAESAEAAGTDPTDLGEASAQTT